MVLLTAQTIVNNFYEYTEVSAFLGESWGFWFRTFGLFISIVIGVLTLHRHGHRARLRATVDIVLAENQDKELLEFKEKYNELRRKKVDFVELARDIELKETKIDRNSDDKDWVYISDNATAIFSLLNHYEFISTAIYKHALDEDMYYRMKGSVFIRNWKTLDCFIVERQNIQKNPKIYCEFRSLAKKWKAKKDKEEARLKSNDK